MKVIQRLQLVYEWKYLFPVVDFARGKLAWAWMDSMKSETVARAVLSVRRYREVRALVWDGARSHRSELVKSMVGVKTIVQPPYSPELNPVERVFEEVRRWVEGRVYGSIEEKVAAVNACLSGLESDPERVKSLVGWEWIKWNGTFRDCLNTIRPHQAEMVLPVVPCESRTHQPVQAHTFLCRSCGKRAVRFRRYPHHEFSAVCSISDWFGRRFVRGPHIGQTVRYKLPNAGERAIECGRQPDQR